MTNVKLTKNTIDILKNFATINSGITIREGSKLRTRSEANNIIGEADVDENFPQEFSIYDLNEFLAVVSLFKEPVLKFAGDKSVDVKSEDGKNKATYFFADPGVVTAAPNKSANFPTPDVTFQLTQQNMTNLLKSCSILQLPNLVVKGGNGVIDVIAMDVENPTGNVYAVRVSEDYTGADCSLVFNAINWKLIPDTYNVSLTFKGYAKFVSEAGDLSYLIALEKTSTHG